MLVSVVVHVHARVRSDEPEEGYMPEQPVQERLFFSIKDAGRIVDASRTTLYEEIAAGRLRVVKRGRRTPCQSSGP